jgi:hypothetical protein
VSSFTKCRYRNRESIGKPVFLTSTRPTVCDRRHNNPLRALSVVPESSQPDRECATHLPCGGRDW